MSLSCLFYSICFTRHIIRCRASLYWSYLIIQSNYKKKMSYQPTKQRIFLVMNSTYIFLSLFLTSCFCTNISFFSRYLKDQDQSLSKIEIAHLQCMCNHWAIDAANAGKKCNLVTYLSHFKYCKPSYCNQYFFKNSLKVWSHNMIFHPMSKQFYISSTGKLNG